MAVESIHDTDLDNDGLPDWWVDKGKRVFKNTKYLEAWQKYTVYDKTLHTRRLDTATVLVDVVKELRKIRKLMESNSFMKER